MGMHVRIKDFKIKKKKEVGQNIKDKETKEVGMEICLGKGVLKEREVSKHQETLSLVGLWRAFKSQRAK